MKKSTVVRLEKNEEYWFHKALAQQFRLVYLALIVTVYVTCITIPCPVR